MAQGANDTTEYVDFMSRWFLAAMRKSQDESEHPPRESEQPPREPRVVSQSVHAG